jgi:hypothetical protein
MLREPSYSTAAVVKRSGMGCEWNFSGGVSPYWTGGKIENVLAGLGVTERGLIMG